MQLQCMPCNPHLFPAFKGGLFQIRQTTIELGVRDLPLTEIPYSRTAEKRNPLQRRGLSLLGRSLTYSLTPRCD